MTENEKRERCLELLEQVPDSGLDEMLERLQEIRDFWQLKDTMAELRTTIPPNATYPATFVITGFSEGALSPLGDDETFSINSDWG